MDSINIQFDTVWSAIFDALDIFLLIFNRTVEFLTCPIDDIPGIPGSLSSSFFDILDVIGLIDTETDSLLVLFSLSVPIIIIVALVKYFRDAIF